MRKNRGFNSCRLSSQRSAIRRLLVAVSCLLCSVGTDLSFAAPLGPRLSVLNSSFDFGTVEQGVKVVHEFELRNDGDEELKIERVVPACGCTATQLTAPLIAPGASGKVRLEFDSSGFVGTEEKSARLFSNDPNKPFVTLSLKGNIEVDYVIKPSRIMFGEVLRGDAAAQEVTIQMKPGSKGTIGSISTLSPYLTVSELESSSTKRRITVALKPETNPGEIRTRLVVDIAGPSSRSVNIPVFGSVKGRATITPNAVSFGVVDGNGLLERTVRLKSSPKDPLKLQEAISDEGAVSASFTQVKPGVYDVVVKLDPAQMKRDIRGKISLRAAEERDSMALSVYAMRPPKVE